MQLSDICCVQPVTPDNKIVSVKTSCAKNGSWSFAANKEETEFNFSSKEQVYKYVSNAIFTKCAIIPNNEVEILREQFNIAKTTRRGAGKTIGNIVCYVGNFNYDGGIIAYHNEDKTKWGVWFADNWTDYYRVISNES